MTAELASCTIDAQHIAAYLRDYEIYYPGIEAWQRNITSDKRPDARSILAVVGNRDILGLAITKNGRFGKLCHISIGANGRWLGLGTLLMRAAVNELFERGARHVHVTTGPEVTHQYGGFFENCGFGALEYQPGRYHEDRVEFCWGASARDLKRRLFERDVTPNVAPSWIYVVRVRVCEKPRVIVDSFGALGPAVPAINLNMRPDRKCLMSNAIHEFGLRPVANSTDDARFHRTRLELPIARLVGGIRSSGTPDQRREIEKRGRTQHSGRGSASPTTR